MSFVNSFLSMFIMEDSVVDETDALEIPLENAKWLKGRKPDSIAGKSTFSFDPVLREVVVGNKDFELRLESGFIVINSRSWRV